MRRFGQIPASRERDPSREAAVRNLPEGSGRAALAEVDIAVIFDEERFGKWGRRHGGGGGTPPRRRRGGQRGVVRCRRLSKLGERGGVRTHIPAGTQPAVRRPAFRATFTPRRECDASMCECVMNAKPVRPPVPELATCDREAAAAL